MKTDIDLKAGEFNLIVDDEICQIIAINKKGHTVASGNELSLRLIKDCIKIAPQVYGFKPVRKGSYDI